MYTVKYSELEMVKYLLKKGININAFTSSKGKYVMDLCIKV